MGRSMLGISITVYSSGYSMIRLLLTSTLTSSLARRLIMAGVHSIVSHNRRERTRAVHSVCACALCACVAPPMQDFAVTRLAILETVGGLPVVVGELVTHSPQ